jgi:RNA polymerase sigma-70 factor (ECF subfamily)
MKGMSDPVVEPLTPETLERFLTAIRPKVHRYCARMAGSAIDGEDILQEAMIKALRALQKADVIYQPEPWMFRIAHNAALDFLRRRTRIDAAMSGEDPEMLEDPKDVLDHAETVATSLQTFMRLPSGQRSSVILMDVLGYSLQEIGEIMDASIPAVKSALNRGRTRLRTLAADREDLPPPSLSNGERSLLSAYIEHFNARNFDAVRDMLADEVRLELVAHKQMNGRKEVQTYFGNYSAIAGWHMRLGFVDRRPAMLVYDGEHSDRPAYFVLLEWAGGAIALIRDFRYAAYAIDGALIHTENAGAAFDVM